MKRLLIFVTLFSTLHPAPRLCLAGEGRAPVTVTVTEAVLTQGGNLRCKWKIRNDGNKITHVYASYLGSATDDMVDARRGGQMILIRTTWLQETSAYPAYYVPPAEFIDLAPGAEKSGVLLVHLPSFSKSTIARRLQLVVAFGTNIAKLKADIKESARKGVEFQGNPIVRWQTLAYSAPTSIMQR